MQFSGINAVLYFTPQILMQSGAGDLLANVGIDGESASILASGVTCFLMLPCILVAMWLMDRSGRRYISLSSLPFDVHFGFGLLCVLLKWFCSGMLVQICEMFVFSNLNA